MSYKEKTVNVPERKRDKKKTNLIWLLIKEHWPVILGIVLAAVIVITPIVWWKSKTGLEKLEIVLNFFEWLRSLGI